MSVTPFPDAPTLEPEPSVVPPPELPNGSILARAAALRFPNLRELSGGAKIEALIDHITDTAIVRGELEQLRLETHVDLLRLEGEWRELDVPSNKTQAQAVEIRRLRNPTLTTEVETARWLIARCTEQISRLGGTDYDAASRAYSLLGA